MVCNTNHSASWINRIEEEFYICTILKGARMKCPSCGYDNKEDAQYCNLCLTSFVETDLEIHSSDTATIAPTYSQTTTMTDDQDLSNIYVPLWNRQILSNAIAFIFGLAAIILSIQFGNTAILIAVIIVWVISYLSISLLLRCPACDCLLCWKSKTCRSYAFIPFIPIPWDNTCPECGVILRN